jgi:hypothetical protein
MPELGSGTREDLVRLGGEMDASMERALALTEKVLRIRNRLGRNEPLAANDAQHRYARAAWGKRSNIVLKARQMGITTWIAGRFFLKTITHPGTVTVQVAHTQEAAEAIFRIVHRFLNQLPGPLREGTLKNAKSSARRIAFPALDSEYLVETAGDRNAGRGLTITNLHCTELARWPGDPGETLAGLRATLSPEGELVMESTPNGASGCFWKEWREAEKTGTVRHFFPWWLEEVYSADPVDESSLTEEERRLRDREKLSLGQIGCRRHLQENFRGLARQEYAEDAESCFLASGSCWFEVAAIDEQLRVVRAPAEKRGDLWIWAKPQPARQYLVAVDPCGGSPDGDYAAAQVIDREQGLQCAELRTRRSPLETAMAAADLAREYNHALLAVERNNHGHGVLAHLHSACQYDRVYRGADGQDGWLTSLSSRPAMLADLGAALVQTPALFSSERLLRECRTFVRGAGGNGAAAAGEHDDCVMAMALALAVRKEQCSAKRLQ